MPGFGFSGKPTTTGWDPLRIARAWIVLMQRLGYTRCVAQGGDWGSFVVEMMALQAPPELIGIHTNFPHAVPPHVSKAIQSGGVAPSDLSDDDLSSSCTPSTWLRGSAARHPIRRPQMLHANWNARLSACGYRGSCATRHWSGRNLPRLRTVGHRGMRRMMSELQGGDPLVLVLARGSSCPKDRRQSEQLLQLHRKMQVRAERTFLSDQTADCGCQNGRDARDTDRPLSE
jgi:pimeloyl-ACP methyl ester carboxylesterase